MKKLLYPILAVVAVVALVASILYQLTGTYSLSLSPSLGKNLRNAHMTSSTSADYFNGSQFMQVNLTDQTSKALSPRYSLPNVLDVRWGSTGALFKATGYGASDQLKHVLELTGASTSQAYWWYVDFKTGAIAPVGSLTDAATDGSVVNDVIWAAGDKGYYYIQTPTFPDAVPTTNLFYRPLGADAQKLGASQATSLLWGDDAHVYYQVSQNDTGSLNEIALPSMSNRTILGSFGGTASVDPTGNQALIITSTANAGETASGNSKGALELMNLATGKTTKVAKTFAGTIAWSQDGTGWVALGTGILNGYIARDGKKPVKLNLSARKKSDAPTDAVVIGYESERALVVDGQNNGYLVGKTLPSYSSTPPENSGDISFENFNSLLTYGVSSAQLADTTYILTQYVNQSKQAVASVKLDADSIVKTPHDRNSASMTDTISFNCTLSTGTKLAAKLNYSSLSASQLTLLDPLTGATVFSSGAVDLTAN